VEDIELLANHLLNQFMARHNKRVAGITDRALDAMRHHPWPGNVRELQNCIQNIVVLHDDEEVTAKMLPLQFREGQPAPVAKGLQAEEGSVVEPLWIVEKRAIEQAIEQCDGNVNRAAGLLEVAPSTIYRKVQSWQ